MLSFIRKYAGFFLLLFGVIGIIVINGFNKDSDTTIVTSIASPLTYQQTTTSNLVLESVFVDIKGEVLYPGVYEVGKSMRISDVILLSGGLLPSADVSKINLSKNVYDELVIIIPKSETIIEVQTQSEFVYVDIKGEVLVPGVYKLEQGKRIMDALLLAGGLTNDADTSSINLSLIVSDQLVIFIPEKSQSIDSEDSSSHLFKVTISGEIVQPGQYFVDDTYTLQTLINEAGGVTINADTTNLLYSMPLYIGFELSIPNLQEKIISSGQDLSGKININKANLEALMTLKGIGIILGQRIIDYRAEFGDFLSIEDIVLVSGIKDSIYEQIKDYITV
ncbi:MAG: SLBB domain-containing protein [Firmicutes bacterium]|nr:SLBB domain-containing protein [Bacillota bacterium]